MRYLRIREYADGSRMIEAWVREEQPLLPPLKEESEPEVTKFKSGLIALSLFGWGFLGIVLGNTIFYGV